MIKIGDADPSQPMKERSVELKSVNASCAVRKHMTEMF